MSKAINSTAERNYKGIFFFAVIWNLFSFFIAFVILNEKLGWPVPVESIRFNDPVLLVLLFPLIGIYLAGYAFKEYRQWKKYGRLDLYLNPEHGSIGGEIGGEVDLPIPYRAGRRISAVVSCINTTISSSNDQGSRRHEKVIWRKNAAVDSYFTAKGTRIRFVAPVDNDLPATTPPSGDYIQWVVRIQDNSQRSSAGHVLDRKFEIPVFKQDIPKKSTIRIHNEVPIINSEDIPERFVAIKQTGDQLSLVYPRFRSIGMALSLTVFSVFFLGPAGFMLKILMEEPDALYQMVILSSMILVFGLFGLLMLLMGLDLLTNKRSVTVTRNEIRTWNQAFFIFNFRRRIQCQDISVIKLKINMSSGQGADATAYYRIIAEARDAKNRVTLGDGIQGQLVADALARRIIDFTGRSDLTIRNDVGKKRFRKKKKDTA